MVIRVCNVILACDHELTLNDLVRDLLGRAPFPIWVVDVGNEHPLSASLYDFAVRAAIERGRVILKERVARPARYDRALTVLMPDLIREGFTHIVVWRGDANPRGDDLDRTLAAMRADPGTVLLMDDFNLYPLWLVQDTRWGRFASASLLWRGVRIRFSEPGRVFSLNRGFTDGVARVIRFFHHRRPVRSARARRWLSGILAAVWPMSWRLARVYGSQLPTGRGSHWVRYAWVRGRWERYLSGPSDWPQVSDPSFQPGIVLAPTWAMVDSIPPLRTVRVDTETVNDGEVVPVLGRLVVWPREPFYRAVVGGGHVWVAAGVGGRATMERAAIDSGQPVELRVYHLMRQMARVAETALSAAGETGEHPDPLRAGTRPPRIASGVIYEDLADRPAVLRPERPPAPLDALL